MSQAIQPFLSHAFEVAFSSFPKEAVTNALDAYDESRELIVSDIRRKFSKVADSADFDSGLADILETDSTIQAAVLYRLSRVLFVHDEKHPSLRYLAYLMKTRTGADIYYSTKIGPGLMIQHGVGCVIGPRHHIGKNFTVYQGVTLGQRKFNAPEESITVGDDCMVFAGAKVLGSVVIGNNTRIAANAVLLSNAESNSTYAGIPAVRVKSQ